MGNFISAIQQHLSPEIVLACNLNMVKEPISRVRELHNGFKMLCESFAVSLKEFEQIFCMSEAVFSVWDTDSNGLIDCIEFFTAMIVFSDARIEDKLRFLLDIFDFNENGYLTEIELHFLAFNVLTATAKVFGVEIETPSFPNSNGNAAYNTFNDLLRMTFPKNPMIGSKELIRWVTESPDLREFFSFVDVIN